LPPRRSTFWRDGGARSTSTGPPVRPVEATPKSLAVAVLDRLGMQGYQCKPLICACADAERSHQLMTATYDNDLKRQGSRPRLHAPVTTIDGLGQARWAGTETTRRSTALERPGTEGFVPRAGPARLSGCAWSATSARRSNTSTVRNWVGPIAARYFWPAKSLSTL
jgi:hypothetical protein